LTEYVSEKPFWLQPPHVLLFDLIRLHRLKPWDVNITFLLNSFLAEMKKSGYIDFTASGTALLSSAVIHRMKSELVLKLEEPPKPQLQRISEEVPPPLPLPIRYEFVSASAEQLLRALEEVLESERAVLAKQKNPILLPAQLTDGLDEFLTDIDRRLEAFYLHLKELSSKSPSISFVTLTRGLPIVEIIRRFIMVLFLACQKRLVLYQDHEFGDIAITLTRTVSQVGAE